MSDGAVSTLDSSGATGSVTATPAWALIGATLEGAYTIKRLVAEGGMSAVYEAVQLRLNQRVAVKVLARSLTSNHEALARFRREAEITSRLRHPHLVSVTDFGTAPDGEPYLVMEYLDGQDLDHRIRQVGRLPLPTVLHITKQVASALAAAHDQGIVHRDLKPANIFLVELPGEPDFAKVLDFGISKVRAASSQLTKAKSVIGTPNYMSPEQASGQLDDIDERTDQWALACIVWEMLAGRPPFASDDVSAVFYQVINLDPQPIGRRAPDLPPAVEPVLLRALSKCMTNRYSSVRDFAEALAEAATGNVTAHPIRATEHPSQNGGRHTVERRQARHERRRTDGTESSAGSIADTSDAEIEAAARASFGRLGQFCRALKPVHVLVALAAVLLPAVLLLRPSRTARTAPPTRASSTAVAARPTIAPPQPAATVVAPSQAVLATSPAVLATSPAVVAPTPHEAPRAVTAPASPRTPRSAPAGASMATRPPKQRLVPEMPDTREASDPFEGFRRREGNAAKAPSRVDEPEDPFARPSERVHGGRHSSAEDVDPFAP